MIDASGTLVDGPLDRSVPDIRWRVRYSVCFDTLVVLIIACTATIVATMPAIMATKMTAVARSKISKSDSSNQKNRK